MFEHKKVLDMIVSKHRLHLAAILQSVPGEVCRGGARQGLHERRKGEEVREHKGRREREDLRKTRRGKRVEQFYFGLSASMVG